MNISTLIQPDWAAPTNVHAFMTTRMGGVSGGAYGDLTGKNGLNPASHVGDEPTHVLQNRALIRAHVPNEPQWLNQTHSTLVWHGDYDSSMPTPEADAVVIDEVGQVGVIMTADCLPVVFASGNGKVVAAAHAGWQGLANGVLEQTLNVMQTKGVDLNQVHAWFGAAIGPSQFEVGQDVVDKFTTQTQADVSACFKPAKIEGKYWADIYALARLRLGLQGVTRVTGGEYCTVSDAERFYSYRRDKVTGRMATLIWLNDCGQ